MCALLDKKQHIAIVGPSATYISGSLLRPLNIWYSLKSLGNVQVHYISIKSIAQVLLYVRSLRVSNIIIVSGHNPWVSAFLVLLGRLLQKIVFVDIHGSAWYEASITGSKIYWRFIFFVSELILYRFSQWLICASQFLHSFLNKYFSVDSSKIFIIENAITPIFEKVYGALSKYKKEKLKRIVERFTKLNIGTRKILLSPLPGVFIANIKALHELEKLKIKDFLVIVTGTKCSSSNNISCMEYLPYSLYVAILLISDGTLLPYPPDAVCGGSRNKVLETLYCGVPLITTHIGVLHTNLKPYKHYIPLKDPEWINIVKNSKVISEIVSNAKKKAYTYSFRIFKFKLFRALLKALRSLRTSTTTTL